MTWAAAPDTGPVFDEAACICPDPHPGYVHVDGFGCTERVAVGAGVPPADGKGSDLCPCLAGWVWP